MHICTFVCQFLNCENLTLILNLLLCTEKYYGVLFSHSKIGEKEYHAALGVSVYISTYMEVITTI